MMSAGNHAVTVEKQDRSVETVSRSRVVLAPTPCTEKNTKAILQPTKLRSNKKLMNPT